MWFTFPGQRESQRDCRSSHLYQEDPGLWILELIGHILLGRDIVREAAALQAAAGNPVDAETMLCLEHIIVSHQRLPEWGSPKQPMTPEALIVHHADDLDASFQMMLAVLAAETGQHDMTRKKTAHRTRVFRGFHSP